MQICNLTTPAQYFHALRRQVKAPFRKPLVLMTPKSLLRHPRVVSSLNDLAQGTFQAVLDDVRQPEQIERVVLCSGKVYYDLLDKRESTECINTALIRLEQLYPFPVQSLQTILEKYSQAREFVWVQEEHRNWGAWTYMHDRFSRYFYRIPLHCISREGCPSSATGSFREHQEEQTQLMERAFAPLTCPVSLHRARTGELE